MFPMQSPMLGRDMAEQGFGGLRGLFRQRPHAQTGGGMQPRPFPRATTGGGLQPMPMPQATTGGGLPPQAMGLPPQAMTGGDDPAQPMIHPMTGGGLPSEIWARFMKAAHRNVEVANLPGTQNGIFAPMASAGGSYGRPVPPGAIDGRSAAAQTRNDGMDSWLIDRLFGRR